MGTIFVEHILEIALEAGRILLRNGAEIFRVEETIEHICKRFGVEAVDSFVLSNGIFLTAYSKGKENFAKVKHVPMAGIHLGIVTEVNDLSREISAGRVGIDEAFRRLEEIEKLPPKKSLYLVLAAGLGIAGYCGILVMVLCIAIIAGLLCWFLRSALKQKNQPESIIQQFFSIGCSPADYQYYSHFK